MKLIVYALAVWRLAHMVVKEPGPADIFSRLRVHLIGGPTIFPEWTGRGIQCVSCVSVWAAFLLLIVERTPLRWITVVLAGSAVAKLLEDYLYEEGSDGFQEEEMEEKVWGEPTSSPFIPDPYWGPIGNDPSGRALRSR